MTPTLLVDFDPNEPPTYRAVIITGVGQPDLRFDSGKPVADWSSAVAWQFANQTPLALGTTVPTFLAAFPTYLLDLDGYTPGAMLPPLREALPYGRTPDPALLLDQIAEALKDASRTDRVRFAGQLVTRLRLGKAEPEADALPEPVRSRCAQAVAMAPSLRELAEGRRPATMPERRQIESVLATLRNAGLLLAPAADLVVDIDSNAPPTVAIAPHPAPIVQHARALQHTPADLAQLGLFVRAVVEAADLAPVYMMEGELKALAAAGGVAVGHG